MSKLLTEAELAAIAERADRATPGSWVMMTSWRDAEMYTSPNGVLLGDRPEYVIAAWTILGGVPDEPSEGWSIVHGNVEKGSIQPTDDDLSFIAAARTDIPRLLADLRRYRGWCERLMLEMRPGCDLVLWEEVRVALEESK